MPRSFTTPGGEVLTLDPSQDAAVDRILTVLATGSEAILVGAAGCGKSVLMSVVEKEWGGNVLLLGPTGKAANRLAETTGRLVKTIHSAVFKTVEEVTYAASGESLVFGEPAPPKGVRQGTLVIVDEASMVNEKLAGVLREQVFSVGGKILWVGDHEQLPPVNGRWGARLDHPTAKLETVHRQALESAVLELATLIRQGNARTFTNWGDDVKRINPATIEQAVAWMEESRAVDALAGFAPAGAVKLPTRILLTWTNEVRVQANRLTRLGRDYPQGEVVSGETLLCTFNNHSLGRMNGEIVEVSRVEECPEMTECLGTLVQWVTEVDGRGKETRFLVVPETFDSPVDKKSERQVYRDVWKPLWAKNKPQLDRDGKLPESAYQLLSRMDWSWDDLRLWRDNARAYGLQGTWGYCLTVHKSQGSQWDEVGFISCPGFRGYDNHEFKRRLTYTAVTRAAERFTAFMLSVVPDYRRKNPYGGQ